MTGAVSVGVVDVLVMRAVTKGWQVLVLQRAANTRCPGSWEMVHGKVLPGETLEAAARRELHEETGCTPNRLISVTMHPFYLLPTQTVQLRGLLRGRPVRRVHPPRRRTHPVRLAHAVSGAAALQLAP